jgi:hypothetical protein
MADLTFYVLDARGNPRATTSTVWAKFLNTDSRVIIAENLVYETEIRTRFYGVDWGDEQMMFATRYRDPHDGMRKDFLRYDTLDEARAGHSRALDHFASRELAEDDLDGS